MSEELSDFPTAFGKPDVMPWDEQPAPVLWQWGMDRGKPLTEIESRELVRKRKWVVEKQGAGTYFAALIQAIDDELFSRGGL